MKVTIEYTLPEEREEMEQAVKGHEYAAALYELDQKLRSLIKHDNSLSEAHLTAYQHARDMLHAYCSERGLTTI